MVDTFIYNLEELPFEHIRNAVKKMDAKLSVLPRRIHGYRYWKVSYGQVYIHFDGIIRTDEIRHFLASVYKRPRFKPEFEIDFGFSTTPIYINKCQHEWNVTTWINVKLSDEEWESALELPSFQKTLKKHL